MREAAKVFGAKKGNMVEIMPANTDVERSSSEGC